MLQLWFLKVYMGLGSRYILFSIPIKIVEIFEEFALCPCKYAWPVLHYAWGFIIYLWIPPPLPPTQECIDNKLRNLLGLFMTPPKQIYNNNDIEYVLWLSRHTYNCDHPHHDIWEHRNPQDGHSEGHTPPPLPPMLSAVRHYRRKNT